MWLTFMGLLFVAFVIVLFPIFYLIECIRSNAEDEEYGFNQNENPGDGWRKILREAEERRKVDEEMRKKREERRLEHDTYIENIGTKVRET